VVITLSLAVTPDGRVKPTSILVDRSSGYPQWDQEVIGALCGWRFKSLPPEEPQEDVWGRVTFMFQLM
jgi:TonB family protein